MRFVRYCTIAATVMATLLAIPSGRGQGLYGDEGKNVTSGGLNNPGLLVGEV